MPIMKIPALHPAIPQRGNRFSRWLGRSVLRAFGWQIQGEFPSHSRFIIIGAPHTSNWDFIFGMAAANAMGIRISWMGKHTLFTPPAGYLMRWMGGIPINRSAAFGVVEQMAENMKGSDALVLGITPEGTRKAVKKWKTGFYHIAKNAEVPMVLGYFDYRRKIVGIGPTLQAGEDMAQDLQTIEAFYRQHAVGKYPQTITVR